MSQLDYRLNQIELLAGQRADNEQVDAPSYTNPSRAEVHTLTFGGTPTDGDYVATITFNSSHVNGLLTRPQTQAFTVTRATTPATDTDLAVAMAAVINAQTNLAKATSAAAVVTVTFANANLLNTIVTADPAPGTLTDAITVTAGGSNIRVGTLVAQPAAGVLVGANNRTLVPITTGTVAADIVGIAERSNYTLFQDAITDALGFDIHRSGFDVACGARGRWAVEVFEDVEPGDVPIVWINEGTPADLGLMGGGSAGGDRLDVSSIIRFDSEGVAGGLAIIQVGRN